MPSLRRDMGYCCAFKHVRENPFRPLRKEIVVSN